MNPKNCIFRNFKAFNTRDEDGLVDTYTEDCVLIDMTQPGKVFGGHDFLREYLRATYNIFPDIHIENEHVISEGHTVAAQFEIVGTHKGEFLDCPPSNNLIRWQTCSIFELIGTDDRIKKETYYYDKASLIDQLRA